MIFCIYLLYIYEIKIFWKYNQISSKKFRLNSKKKKKEMIINNEDNEEIKIRYIKIFTYEA